jgi:uncharacterized membrane protein
MSHRKRHRVATGRWRCGADGRACLPREQLVVQLHVVEIVLTAIGIIALLIAIFPANLHIALYNVPLSGAAEGLGIWNWVRLPFQLVLIAWAWWYTRE